MNKIGMMIGGVVGAAALIAAAALLRNRAANNAEPLVRCAAPPNLPTHDQPFIFLLNVNSKNKNAANFELESISVSDGGIAVHANVEKLVVSGPFHPGLVDTVRVEKNIIDITPVKDEREQIEQAVLLHVAVKLKDKKRKTTTITSAICETTIVHAPKKVAPPPLPPPQEPKPKPPILIKDKSGTWVEPPKPSTKTPSFESHYDKSTTDGTTAIGVGITPQDLAGRKFVRIEIQLASRNYSLPTPTRTSLNLNLDGWYSSDWNCSVENDVVRCAGQTPLVAGKKTPIVMEMQASVENLPASINVNLFDDQGAKIDLDVPYQSGSVL